jgi:hypothetical protein
MSQVTEDLRADLSRARTWVLVNGPSADAAVVSAAILGEPVRVPDHTYESATADFRCAMRDAITAKRLADLRQPS